MAPPNGCNDGEMSRPISMRKIREILRLKHVGRSHREIAGSVCIAVGTVCTWLQRAREAGVTWERVQGLSDAEANALLFGDGPQQTVTRAPLNYGYVHKELHRTGVTLQLLWEEYQAAVVARQDGIKPYKYSQYCELYRVWSKRQKPSMRQVHIAGEKAFIDYSGKKPRLWDPLTGESRELNSS